MMARLFALFVFFALALAPLGAAQAHIGHDRPKLELGKRPPVPKEGPRGRAAVSPAGKPLVLGRTADGSYVGGFEIKNTGDGPLQVYRVGIRGADDGGSKPPVGLGIQTLPKASTILPPGESRLYNVVWRPDQTNVTQAFAHVVIDTDSAAPGATSYDPPLHLGVVADRRPLALRHILAVAILLPLLLAALAFASRFRLAGGERALRAGAVGVGIACIAASALPLVRFLRGVGRDDGNDGLQFIERGSMLGLDVFLGVDGLTAPLLPIPAIVFLACALATHDGKLARFCMIAAPLTTASMLLLAAQSLPLLAVALTATALFGGMVATTRSSSGKLRGGAFKLLTAGALASAAFALLTHHLARSTPGVIGIDGNPSELAWSLPDVARELSHGHVEAANVLGLPAPQGLFVLAVITAAALSFAAPFHRVGAEIACEAEAADATMAIALYSLAGGFVLLRFGVLLVPDAARWGAPALATIGVVTLVGAIARAAIEDDLRGLAGVLPSATGGAMWLMASSLTPQGTQGAIAVTLARPLAAALLVLCAGALVSRAGVGALDRWGGVGRTAPLLATALVVALAATAAIPGGAAFWGAWLGLVGTVGRAPVTAVALAAGLAATAAAHARLWRVVAGPPSPAWERSPALEPYGGTLPDLRQRRDRGWAFILVAALVVLTLSPRAWLGVTNHVVLDALPIADPPGPTQVASL